MYGNGVKPDSPDSLLHTNRGELAPDKTSKGRALATFPERRAIQVSHANPPSPGQVITDGAKARTLA